MKIAKIVCIIAVAMLCLPGLLVLPSQAEAAAPGAQYVSGDIIIGTGYSLQRYTFSGADAFYMMGNITVRSGGTLLVKDTTLAFMSTYNNNASKGRLVDRVYTMTVEDGGVAIFENATLTTHLVAFSAFPSLGVVFRAKASLYANDSVFAFSGHMLFDNATAYMKNTDLTAGTENVATYCDPVLFPASLFSSPAVIYQVSSKLQMTNCTLDPLASVPQLDDGAHTITVQATDMNNRIGTQTITIISNVGGTAVIPPRVQINLPSNGATLTGSVPVTTTIIPSSAILTGVQLLIDGVLNSTLTAPPYQFTVDTTALADGLHTITVTAVDFNGVTGSQTINVIANNGGLAEVPPQVIISSPRNDAIITSTTTISANVIESGAAIRSVEFFVDGKRQTTLFSPPYSYTLNTPSGSSDVYVYSYPFLQDTQARNYVSYKLERDLNPTMQINVPSGQPVNLVRNDTLYYTVLANQQFRTSLFDVMPLTFDRNDVESITLKVLYKTGTQFNDLGTPDRIQITPWLAAAAQSTDITITRTSPQYDTSLVYEAQKSTVLAPMSSTELRQLSISYQNTKTDSVQFNRIWVEVKLKASTYGKINATGGSQLTIINSTLPLNMDSGSYGKMVLTQASNAYLYDVAIDATPTSGGNSPYWPGSTPDNAYTPSVVQPERKSNADTTGQSLYNLIYQTGTPYTIARDLSMSLDRFDVPWIKSGQIATVKLSVTYTTGTGYIGSPFITYRLPGGLARNTGIMISDSPTATTATFDLSAVGVDTIDEVRNLTIALANAGTQSIFISRLVLEVQYDPSFYIYRMADISVLDSMGDVVPEATISSYDFQSSPSIQYYTPDGVTSVPPAAVLNYLGRTASDFALTDHLGQATLPLLTDIVSGPNTPNARTLNAYRLRVDITNHTGVHYSATTVASFIPFPDLSAEAMVQAIEVPIPRFVVDKPLLIATNLVLAPYPIYEGQSATLSFQLENQGTAAAYSVVVDFNDRYDLFNITFDSQVVPRLDPGQKITVSATYTAPMLAGAHLLAVTVDPDNLVPELNDTSERFLWLEIRVGSLAVITMAPEGLQIDPAPPTVNITSIISVKIQKEGDQPSTAKSVTILVQYQDGSRYWLNTTVPALPSGSQIYYAEVAWTPTQLGDYNIYAAMRGIGEEKVSTTVLNYCDLVADSLSLYVNLHQTDVAHIGDTVIMEATISNQGQSDAKNFLIRFWLGNIGDGTILGDLLVPQLNSGQAMMASWDWTAINRAGERYSNYTITVEVNPFQPGDHPINETTYANNVIDTPIEVIDDRPYLQLQGVQVLVSNAASQTAVYGQTLKVDFTVLNNGGGLSALTPVSVYLLAPDNTIYFYYQAQITLTGGGSQHITTTATPVTQPVASYTLVVKAISPVSAASYNGSAWFTQVFDITTLVNPNVAINTFGKVEYKPGESVVAVTTITTSGGAPLVGLKATVMLLDSNNNQLGPTYTYTTGEGGGFTAILGIPFDYSGKATVSMSIAAGSQTIDRTLPIQVGSTASGGMPLWQIILIIVIIAAIILFVFWRFFWHKGGKDMVECGECGSLIPANSKKCPNCGVEFDIGKVRCSNCGTYIDQNLTECPECGAKFSRSAAGKESEEDKELRAEYDAFINDIRMQAKAQLGDKYTEEVFAQWLKTEPEYLPFEQWVARKKEREAAPSAKPCPTCGTLNPATATVCSKCGSQMTAAEDKEAPKPRTFRRIVRRSDKKEEGGEEKPSEEEPKKE